MRKSKTTEAIRIAHEKGYRAVEGEIFAPSGKKRKLRLVGRHGDRRKVFTVSVAGMSRPLRVHQLAAFQKFGEAMFEDGVMVRHKNGDILNNLEDNLLLGTNSQNMMDRSPEDRLAHARLAASHQRKY